MDVWEYETHRKVYGDNGKNKGYGMWMLKKVLPIDIRDHEDGMKEMSNKLDCHHRDELVHRIYVEYLPS